MAPSSLRPLSYLAGAALLVGVYARLKGLGAAPFAVDEYYLARSIENILRVGVPAFSCGGYYPRGIALQYLAAALQMAGVQAELAPRLIGVLSSLAALPAAYILGRRMHGRLVGILAVTILALSLWEIEMARFGRMYAPFQAVFLWYLVYFLRYTVDRDSKALLPMFALAVAGPLVWEGGVFLLVVNLLPVFLQRPTGRLAREDWGYVGTGIALLLLAFWWVTYDFRGLGGDAWPLGYDPSLVTAPVDVVARLPAPLRVLPHHPWWVAAAIIPLAALLIALRWIWSLRSRPLLAAGLLVMLLAAAVHQWLAVIAIGMLLLLMRFIDWGELSGRAARPFHIALIVSAAFWLAFGVVTVLPLQHTGTGGAAQNLALLGYQFLRVPDFVGVVVRPWARTLPHLGLALLVLLLAAVLRMARSNEPLNAERTLLVLFIVLLLAASASSPPRQETRYVFNLYPLAIIIALTALTRIVGFFTLRPAVAAGVTTAVALGGFALSEDFQPHHLGYIDTPAETFRVGMTGDMQTHLVVREDYRSLARWLQQNATGNTLVINSVHGLDHYFGGIDYFYVELHTPDFEDWACRRGTVERWGNYRVLSSVDSLATAIASAPRAYLVAFGYDNDRLLTELAPLHPRIATTQGHIVVVELRG